MFATYHLCLHNTHYALVLEDPNVRENAEVLFNAMKGAENTSGRGKIEGGKKALKIVVVGDGAVGLLSSALHLIH